MDIEETKDMTEFEINQMIDDMLTKGSAEEWKGQMVNLVNKIDMLEQQWWKIGAEIEQSRKVLHCVKEM